MKRWFLVMTKGVVLGLILAHLVSAQDHRRSVEEIERQWKAYTSFQKHELIGFCDFLFDQGYYERAILACFRFIFLYPDDDLVPAMYYWVARSYEETGSYDLAVTYYQQVLSEVDPASTEHRFPRYRITYLNLRQGEYDRVIEAVEGSSDPYLRVFGGYARFSQLRWDEAREYFSRALETFGAGSGQGRLLRRLVRACELSSEVPRGSSRRAALFGVFPGGGRAYLGQWYGALGILVSAFGLGIQVLDEEGSAVAAWISPVALAAVYGASILGSARDVEFANLRREERYVRRVTSVLGPEKFLDFPEGRVFSLQ